MKKKPSKESKSSKRPVQLKDLKAKKNPKGGLIRIDDPDEGEGPGGILIP